MAKAPSTASAKKTKKQGTGKHILYSDIYEDQTIHVKARELDADSQGTISYGLDGSEIISAVFTSSVISSRGAGEKSRGAGVAKEDKIDRAFQQQGG